MRLLKFIIVSISLFLLSCSTQSFVKYQLINSNAKKNNSIELDQIEITYYTLIGSHTSSRSESSLGIKECEFSKAEKINSPMIFSKDLTLSLEEPNCFEKINFVKNGGQVSIKNNDNEIVGSINISLKNFEVSGYSNRVLLNDTSIGTIFIWELYDNSLHRIDYEDLKCH